MTWRIFAEVQIGTDFLHVTHQIRALEFDQLPVSVSKEQLHFREFPFEHIPLKNLKPRNLEGSGIWNVLDNPPIFGQSLTYLSINLPNSLTLYMKLRLPSIQLSTVSRCPILGRLFRLHSFQVPTQFSLQVSSISPLPSTSLACRQLLYRLISPALSTVLLIVC